MPQLHIGLVYLFLGFDIVYMSVTTLECTGQLCILLSTLKGQLF